MSEITTAAGAYKYLYSRLETEEPKYENQYWLWFVGEVVHQRFRDNGSCSSLNQLLWQLLLRQNQPVSDPPMISRPMEHFVVSMIGDLAARGEKGLIPIEQAIFVMLGVLGWRYDVCIDNTSRTSRAFSMSEEFEEQTGFNMRFEMTSKVYREALSHIADQPDLLSQIY